VRSRFASPIWVRDRPHARKRQIVMPPSGVVAAGRVSLTTPMCRGRISKRASGASCP
jgi:hypothetical protein